MRIVVACDRCKRRTYPSHGRGAYHSIAHRGSMMAHTIPSSVVFVGLGNTVAGVSSEHAGWVCQVIYIPVISGVRPSRHLCCTREYKGSGTETKQLEGRKIVYNNLHTCLETIRLGCCKRRVCRLLARSKSIGLLARSKQTACSVHTCPCQAYYPPNDVPSDVDRTKAIGNQTPRWLTCTD